MSLLVAATGLLLLSNFSSCKKDHSAAAPKPYVINFVPAKTPNELQELKADKNANLIRSLADFDAVVAAGNTPFSKLAQSDLQALRSSIVVREGQGVVSLIYGDLAEKMSYDDFATAFSAFGLDIKEGFWGLSKDPQIIAAMSVTAPVKINDIDEPGYDDGEGGDVDASAGKDYFNYYCAGIRSCKKNRNSWCMSGC